MERRSGPCALLAARRRLKAGRQNPTCRVSSAAYAMLCLGIRAQTREPRSPRGSSRRTTKAPRLLPGAYLVWSRGLATAVFNPAGGAARHDSGRPVRDRIRRRAHACAQHGGAAASPGTAPRKRRGLGLTASCGLRGSRGRCGVACVGWLHGSRGLRSDGSDAGTTSAAFDRVGTEDGRAATEWRGVRCPELLCRVARARARMGSPKSAGAAPHRTCRKPQGPSGRFMAPGKVRSPAQHKVGCCASSDSR